MKRVVRVLAFLTVATLSGYGAVYLGYLAEELEKRDSELRWYRLTHEPPPPREHRPGYLCP